MSLQNDKGVPAQLLEQTGSLLDDTKEVVIIGNEKTYGEKLRYMYTVYVCFVTIATGATFALTSATFLDLMSHTSSDIDQGALMVMLNSLGYTIGCLVSGFLYDWYNKEIIFGSSAILAGIFTTMVPVSRMFPIVATLLFICNIFHGSLDNGSTLLCAIVWGDDANPYQQALAVFYAIGGILSPFVAEPFLLKSKEERNVSALDTSFLNSTESLSESSPFANTKLIVPYAIIGVYCMLSSLPFIVMFIYSIKAPVAKNNTEEQKESTEQTKKVNWKFMLVACGSMASFFMAFGYIYGLGEFSMPFLVDYLGWSKTDGARLNSVIWAAMAGGAFVGIFLSKILRPSLMVIANLVPIACGVIVILVAAKAHSILVWIANISVFVGAGPIYPSTVSWVDQRLIRVNGRICSIFLISFYIGGMTNAMLLGYLFKHHSPMWLIYLALGSVAVLWITLIIMFRTNRRLSRHISPNLYNDLTIDGVALGLEREPFRTQRLEIAVVTSRPVTSRL